MSKQQSGPGELAQAQRAYRVLRALWVIVSASHEDAVARDVAGMGERLRAALERGDRAAAAAALRDVRSWLETMAGVVTSRLCQAFEVDEDDPPGSEPTGLA